VSAITKTGLVD